MKKLLLTILTLAASTAIATAADTVTLKFENATDIQGTVIEERPAGTNSENDNGEAKHIQPLQSLKVDGYTFTFSDGGNTKAALYYPMSTNTTAKIQVRVYNGNDLTITAPEGTNMVQIAFTGTNANSALAPTCSDGTFVKNGNNGTWTGSTNTLTLNINATWRITSLEVTTGEGGSVEPPVVPEKAKFVKATSVESGKKYIIVNDGKACAGLGAGKTYGYLQTAPVTENPDGTVSYDEDNALTLTAVEGGYTITDAAGKYYAMSGTYNSFNIYDTPSEAYLWTVTLDANSEATIFNTEKEKTIYYAASYNSWGAYATQGTYALPTLYVMSDNSGIAGIEADNDAPAQMYNLQGIRVDAATATPGIYIVRKGGKTSKVLVK